MKHRTYDTSNTVMLHLQKPLIYRKCNNPLRVIPFTNCTYSGMMS